MEAGVPGKTGAQADVVLPWVGGHCMCWPKAGQVLQGLRPREIMDQSTKNKSYYRYKTKGKSYTNSEDKINQGIL